ncbi:helix-turn-helix transcriptional regulator [Cyclobacterium xiamenense]|uniref:helix-turn-helix transcriptional regulator n=1 Tax=Cyclobacterium xiamenense TaxID=1297121 RepID=UPI0035CF1EE4
MAYSDNISRLSRLTAILLKLQANAYVTIEKLSEHFEVSKRTIYRDLASLEKAGVPIIQIEGKGYGLMEGYRLPPIMFTEAEANALIFGEKMIAKTKDQSLINQFTKATDKIKAVLRKSEREKADFLAQRTIIGKNWEEERTSNYLSDIQKALTNFQVISIEYRKDGATKNTQRELEPFAIYHNTKENWVLIAWCRLKHEFRSFRIDRIQKLTRPGKKFVPHKMTLDEYVEIQKRKYSGKGVTKG